MQVMICFGYGETFTILSDLLGKMTIWFAFLKSAPARVATPEPEIKWNVNSFLPRIPFLADEKLLFFFFWALPEPRQRHFKTSSSGDENVLLGFVPGNIERYTDTRLAASLGASHKVRIDEQ